MSEEITYYTDLVTSQHRPATKFMAWLTANLTILDDVSTCADAINEAFDIDYAVGDQLDAIGKIVGLSRTLPFTPTSASPILSDTDYRKALKCQIGLNQWDGQISTLSPLWADIFPGAEIAIVDNCDMSIEITFAQLLPSLFVEMIEHGMIVPRPQGVLTNFYFSDKPRFTYSKAGSGYDQGYWV